MKLYQDMIGVMKCDDEGNAGKLEDIHQRLQSVEAWRLRAKKMVETTATVLPDMQKHFQHLDQTSTSHISEVLRACS